MFLVGRAVRSPSTCLKTPQYLKEGRLKPFFANNVDIPFARARRLKPCPRKESVRSGKHMRLRRSLYFCVKTTTLFEGASNRKYSQKITPNCYSIKMSKIRHNLTNFYEVS